MNGLQKAIKIANGQTKLAEMITERHRANGKSKNIKQQHVYKWLHHKSGRPVVPPEHCLPIEESTGVTRYELRPDIFGSRNTYCQCSYPNK